MRLSELVAYATDKMNFMSVEAYFDFVGDYLEFVETGIQATIISKNERKYHFFQYRDDGEYNVTRPLNSHLMLAADNFCSAKEIFFSTLDQIKARQRPSDTEHDNFLKTIYTLQQSIGATLDALPSGKSNQARKINGDLFERLIRLLICRLGVNCVSGVVRVPVCDTEGVKLFEAVYQHDLLLSLNKHLKIIGSVKTSSKDRIDKVFVDKFLYNKLVMADLPHVAIFLNDVQRKKTRKENQYGVSSTFLPGHFKAYTIKLNPLDGVYYCDIRPNMEEDVFLASHIKTIDHFFCTDMWELLARPNAELSGVTVSGSE